MVAYDGGRVELVDDDVVGFGFGFVAFVVTPGGRVVVVVGGAVVVVVSSGSWQAATPSAHSRPPTKARIGC